jgi:hypothetical protein
MLKKRPDFLEVLGVTLVDLSSDLKWDSRPPSDSDRTLNSFFGREPPEESEVSSAALVKSVQMLWEAVMYRSEPIDPGQWLAL